MDNVEIHRTREHNATCGWCGAHDPEREWHDGAPPVERPVYRFSMDRPARGGRSVDRECFCSLACRASKTGKVV